MKQHYTQKEYETLLNHLCIVCQTNEQKNEHIIQYFANNGIHYTKRSIPEGDYCLMLTACPELGFPVDTYFFDELFIERKNSLQELASSLYGHKDVQPIVDAVIKRMKAEKIVSGLSGSRIINEIKNQFSAYDDAFLRELKRAKNKEHKYLLVEQPSGWDGILNHDYPNKYSEASYWATLHALEIRYGLRIKFISRENIGREIYTICKGILDSTIAR